VIYEYGGKYFRRSGIKESARQSSEGFEKIVQRRQSISISMEITSTIISTQFDQIDSGEQNIEPLARLFCRFGSSDNSGEGINQKVFHGKIVVDAQAISKK